MKKTVLPPQRRAVPAGIAKARKAPNQVDRDAAGAVPAAPATAANRPKTVPDSVADVAVGVDSDRRLVVRTGRGDKADSRRTVPTRVDLMGAGQGTRTATAGPTPHRREGGGARAAGRGTAGEPGLSDDLKRAPSRPGSVATAKAAATDPMPLDEEKARANPLPRRTGMSAGRRRPCNLSGTMSNRLRCSFTNMCGDLPGGITKIEPPSSDRCGLPVWSPTPTSAVD